MNRRPAWLSNEGKHFSLFLLLLPLLSFFGASVKASFLYTTAAFGISITGTIGESGVVTVPSQIDGKAVVSISASAFRSPGITAVILPSTITYVESQAFKDCTQLEKIRIPNSVTDIGFGLFQGCNLLTNIVFGSGLKSIPVTSFPPGLIEIGVDAASPNYSTEGGILFNKSKTILVRYPPAKSGATYTVPPSISEIGDSAFNGVTALQSVTLPFGLLALRANAFFASGLTNLMIPGSVRSIEDYALAATQIESIEIPESVTTLGQAVLANCLNLTNATIRPSIQALPILFFGSCVSLANVTLPNSLTGIGNAAFISCSSLTGITIPEGVKSISPSAFQDAGLESIIIPGGVTTFGDGLFSGCGRLTNVVIGNGIQSLGQEMFAGCTNLTTIDLPSTINSIKSSAFYRTGLRYVVIPASVSEIGDYAFATTNITSVLFKGNRTFAMKSPMFESRPQTTFMYMPGTTGWSNIFEERPMVVWNATIQNLSTKLLNSGRVGFRIIGPGNFLAALETTRDLNAPWSRVKIVQGNAGSFDYEEELLSSSRVNFYTVAPP
jgi:hypothetical protein